MAANAGARKLPHETLRNLVLWFHVQNVAGVIIGGIAVSLMSRPRVTRDVDAAVLLDPASLQEFLAAGASFGFVPRLTDALEFARRNQVLLVHHKPTAIDVDISLGSLPFEKETVARAKMVDVGGFSLPLPTPEDLIIMKAVAHRPRDLADIESILEAHPKLDFRRVRGWVRNFASALEMPEIVKDLEVILAQRRKHGRSRR